MPLLEKKLYRNTIKHLTEDTDFRNPHDIIESWNGALTLIEENLEAEIKGLRSPQLGAIYAALAHWSYSNSVATVVMPTGTGKTETMLSLLIQTRCPKLLAIVPTDPLREQISKKFISLGLLKEFNILNHNALHPIVGILKTRFSNAEEASDFISQCNVVVTTASCLSGLSSEVFKVFTDSFTCVFIDEAHHSEATTWFEIRDKFKEKKVLQFTATPYRNDGKKSKAEIIYSYPLRKAQQEGYFKKIEFIPLHEYEPSKADHAIATTAVAVLREDRKLYPHILLARVDSKRRADQVFEIYKQYAEFKVAKIYSGIADKENIKNAIANKEFQIVVCVDMLGEGFDLPELQIAAFHDVKKSLPTTIQFTGRFTRTIHDQELGSAKIIVNLGGLKIDDNELDELYAQDNDWNELLPRISESHTQNEIEFQETLAGFNNIEDFIVSLRELKPAMSTVIYKSASQGWNPKALEKYLKKDKRHEIVKFLENNEKKILLSVIATKTQQKWTDNLDIFNLSWTLNLIHWNEEQGLLFIHGSDNDGLYENIAKKLIGGDVEIIDGKNNGQIFRCLDGVKRFKLQNVGLIQLLGKLIRFQMSVGTDIEAALTKSQISRAKKSHVFGVGFENGAQVSIGCSYKGRIWSQIRDDVNVFIKWCEKIGAKVLDENIDPEQVLKGAIVPKSVPERPSVFPVCIDWGNEMYQASEDRFIFKTGGKEYSFYNSELLLIDPSTNGNIKFGLVCNNETIAAFELQIFQASADYNDFKFVRTFPNDPVFISYGMKEVEIEKFFYDVIPEIWFADGSVLEGSSLSEIKEDAEPYDREKIEFWDWAGIDLKKESQGIEPKIADSIQYRCIDILKTADYDIIYDDDYSGEIADVITIKKYDDKFSIELYHLKFAHEGKINKRIDNLYEVCGQAQKSIHWKFKKGKEFFDHLLRRKIKSRKGKECSRIIRGTEALLKEYMSLAKHKLQCEFKIFIVQPSIRKSIVTSEQLTLLGVTETYLKEKGQIELGVIGSE